MRKMTIAIMLGIAILLLAGCGEEPMLTNSQNTEDNHDLVEEEVEPVLIPAPEPEPEPKPEPEPEPEEEILPYTYPLTGIGTEEEISNRPMVVLVENSPAARPQSGLDQADIIYEILAEGDITRFVSIFQSKTPEVIGPVRSARSYFVKLGYALDSLFVHAGWSQGAKNILVDKRMQHFDAVYGDHSYYWRSDERKAPHNLYTSIERLQQGAKDKGYRVDGWENLNLKYYKPDAEISGEKAVSIKIPYIGGYYVTYEYYAPDDMYYRFMNGKSHTDKETEEQLVADNILIGRTSHRIIDDVGRRDVNVEGPGEGYLVQKGVIQEVTWQQKNGIVRAYKNGEELKLVPGKTWIHLIPTSSNVTFE